MTRSKQPAFREDLSELTGLFTSWKFSKRDFYMPLSGIVTNHWACYFPRIFYLFQQDNLTNIELIEQICI